MSSDPITLLLFISCVILVCLFILWIFQDRDDKNHTYTRLFSSNPSETPSTPSSPLSVDSIPWSNELTFILNEMEVKLINPNPSELLATYIRDKAGLKGTKLGCEEGGCGACTVVLTKPEGTVSVNSCLRPLCTNDGMRITTVEGIGSISSGLSKEQQSLVDHSGTQCGYCTPGWVSNMHALNTAQQEGGSVPTTGKDLEKYFDGNICRCTGYKPILKAFKSCSSAGSAACNPVRGMCGTTGLPCDGAIEDMCGTVKTHSHANKCTRSSTNPVHSKVTYTPAPLHFYSSTQHWYRPINIEQLSAVLSNYYRTDASVQLVGGNTSIGVTKYLNGTAPYNREDAYNVFIDVNAVPEMYSVSFDPETRVLRVGATATLTELIALLNKHANASAGKEADGINHHSIFSVTAHHLQRIANTQVRNAGTWAGNLGIFRKHSSFPSDGVLSLTMAKATLRVCGEDGTVSSMSMGDFIQRAGDDSALLILSLDVMESEPYSLSPGAINTVADSYKICIREHNAHAQVNAGFNLQISYDAFYSSHGPHCHNARIVFGGVSEKTFIARRTEGVLTGARVVTSTLQRCFQALQADLQDAGISSAYGDPKYRVSVMQSCLYRVFLRCYRKSDIPTQVLSAVVPFVKPESRGTEVYHVDDKTSPLAKPVIKLEAKAQTTGEAVYPSDEPLPPQGLCGALVFTSQCSAILTAIDPAPALALSGVVAFIGAADVPGSNHVANDVKLYLEVGDVVQCVGAPVGVILGISDEVVNRAAAMVRLTYTALNQKPVTSLPQAVAAQSFFDVPPMPSVTVVEAGDPQGAMASSARRVKGKVLATGQSHFYMEAHSSIASRVDGEVFEVTCGTQDPTLYQNTIASILSVDSSKVAVKCLRTGGGFGGKLTGGLTTAASTALATRLAKRPVRIFNTRTADMYMNSGREGYEFDYEIGFDSDGKINAVIYDVYVEAGYSYADALGGLSMAMMWADNAFYLPNYLARAKICYTNTPPRTYVRAPGVVQSCLATGIVVDRVALELGVDAETVKRTNFLQNGLSTILGQVIENSTLDRCWETLLRRSRYAERVARAKQFNSANLWRKRGISIDPVKYGIGWAGYNAGVHVGIYRSDGTVTVTHSGCEIGQGINTKVAQTVAYELGVDISLIRVTASSTDRIANGGTTGGSGTSEVCCQAAVKACGIINSRLKPYREANPSASWRDLLGLLDSDVSLNADGWYSPSSNPNKEEFQYFVWGACVSEVELDVLTGMVNVLSSEIVYDCGRSLNPAVDIGQIEGGFVMGLGYFLQERIDYDEAGMLESVGTWEYKPPLAQDIPSTFNVTLIAGAPNKQGILRSKAVGEPCIVLANSVYFATKMAIMAARTDAGATGYCALDIPMTIDIRQQACLVTPERFVMPI